jgi:hypothetical protein
VIEKNKKIANWACVGLIGCLVVATLDPNLTDTFMALAAMSWLVAIGNYLAGKQQSMWWLLPAVLFPIILIVVFFLPDRSQTP